MIALIGMQGCGSCTRARAWLDSHRIPYTYHERTNEPQVPILEAAGQRVVGFDEKLYAGALKGLYPTHLPEHPFGLGNASLYPPEPYNAHPWGLGAAAPQDNTTANVVAGGYVLFLVGLLGLAAAGVVAVVVINQRDRR